MAAGRPPVDDAAIGWGGLALSLILVVVAVGLSLWQGLRLERDMLWATGRSLAQLLAVAAFTVRRRAPEVPGITGITLVATSGSAALSLFVVFGLGVYPVVGRAVVPIAGMMIGNSIGSIVVASRRILSELADRRAEVEARLALGQAWQQAAKPFVRSALRTALTSQIETTKAVGLVFLPGAMTGLILAGADPVDAVLVQAAIMYLILGCVATNVVVIGLGLTRRLFTPDHRLVRLPRTGG